MRYILQGPTTKSQGTTIERESIITYRRNFELYNEKKYFQ